MSRSIELRWPTVCADCGTSLPTGSRAVYYGPGRVFGRGCHEAVLVASGAVDGVPADPAGSDHASDDSAAPVQGSALEYGLAYLDAIDRPAFVATAAHALAIREVLDDIATAAMEADGETARRPAEHLGRTIVGLGDALDALPIDVEAEVRAALNGFGLDGDRSDC